MRSTFSILDLKIQTNISPRSGTLFVFGQKFWKAYDRKFIFFSKIFFHHRPPTPYPQNAVSGAFQKKIDPKGLWGTVTSRIMLRCISSCQKWIPDKILHRYDNSIFSSTIFFFDKNFHLENEKIFFRGNCCGKISFFFEKYFSFSK